jgi:hypothetical protein
VSAIVAPTSANACGCAKKAAVGAGGGGSGGAVVGGVMCIAGGVIFKAFQYNNQYNRELTRDEALLAMATCGLLPFASKTKNGKNGG